MSHCAKRSRQTTLSDYFPRKKRVTIETSMETGNGNIKKDEEMCSLETEEEMDSQNEMRELLASAAEKRIGLKSKADPVSKNSVKPTDGSGEPTDGSGEPTEGSVEPTEGSVEVTEGSGELTEGSGELFDGSGDLFEGSGELVENTGEASEQKDSDDTSILSNVSDELLNSNSVDDLLSATPAPSTDPSTEEHDVPFNRAPECCAPLPEINRSEMHHVMFSIYGRREGWVPEPYPLKYVDKWDKDHVRMPCSPRSLYPVENANGEVVLENRWEIICRALCTHMKTSTDLQNAIMEYNAQYIKRWSFDGLHAFINDHLDDDQRCIFFEFTLPGMIDLALQLPDICTTPIPLLKRYFDSSVTLSQKQIGCLLANAFFCTYPRRNRMRRLVESRLTEEFGEYPDINFNRLFAKYDNGISRRNCEKLKCILHYFSRILDKEPVGAVTFHKQSLGSFPNWPGSDKNIKEVAILCDGMIEDQRGMLQVDFANKLVGGGVLSRGCVQEEIRFVISPELIVARLFTQSLWDSEALIVTGAERYSKYKGYGDTFRFDGDFQDETPRDSWGRRYTQVVAIDALYYAKTDDQYWVPWIRRELNKAYAGFYGRNVSPENLPGIATGNWGCGAYNGWPHLKFIIQLMAASQTDRNMLYLCFGNKKLQSELKQLYEFIVAKKLNVGNLWTLLALYEKKIPKCYTGPRLFDFIQKYHTVCDSNSTETGNSTSNIESSTSKST